MSGDDDEPEELVCEGCNQLTTEAEHCEHGYDMCPDCRNEGTCVACAREDWEYARADQAYAEWKERAWS